MCAITLTAAERDFVERTIAANESAIVRAQRYYEAAMCEDERSDAWARILGAPSCYRAAAQPGGLRNGET